MQCINALKQHYLTNGSHISNDTMYEWVFAIYMEAIERLMKAISAFVQGVDRKESLHFASISSDSHFHLRYCFILSWRQS